MTRIYPITLALVILFTNTLNAQFGNIEFIENKGQWDNRVKFRGLVPAGAFFVRSSGFTVLQQHAEDIQLVQDALHGHKTLSASGKSRNTLRFHSYDVDFLGSNPNIEVVPDKPLSTYNNYFLGNDPSKWASNCRIYQAVTLKNVYPNVDLRYYTEGGQMKYDLVVKPGADPKRIALKYTGADKIEIKNKELVISTSVGAIKELDPYTYQFANGQRKQISAKYIVKGNEVRFDIKGYDPNQTLIIDPTLIFSSMSGATGSNWGYTATYGPDGSFYGGGISIDNLGFPVSPGAFQQIWGGGTGSPPCDISIIKLNPDGSNRVYATYVGGSLNEQPHSLIVDGGGNLVIAGRTNSTNYPTTGSGMIGTPGGYEIAVTKLNATGTALVGSKKIGGVSDDGVNIRASRVGLISLQQNYGDDGRSEVLLDGGGNIYVASCTQSANFPVTGGVFQSSKAGAQDGVILKMDPSVNGLLFASYLGGSSDDAAYVLAFDATGNVFVAGGTASADFPGPKAGTIGSAPGGGIDGFIAVINPAGTAIIRSTFIGTAATDQIFGIQFDRLGFPYIMGQTRGNWPVINAAYSNAGAPQFIAKLQPDLSAYVYSTRFGRAASTPNISPIAFLVDVCENVYVSGWGGDVDLGSNPFQSSGTTNMPLTSDAIQTAQDGADLYFFVLEKNASSQLYGSYFGVTNAGAYPDHVDGGTSRFDQQGVIYQAVCANCGATGTFPTGPGIVWSPNNGAAATGGCNLGMIKIAFNFSGVEAGIQSAIDGIPRDTAGCVPLTVDFSDTIATGVTFYWNFGDGSPVAITTVPTISHTYTAVGTYQVMLISEDSSTCNIRDTSYMNIMVGDLRAILDFNPIKLAPCDSLKYQFDNLSIAPPSRPFTNTSFKWDFGDGSPNVVTGPGPVFHSYAAPGSYVVKLILQDTGYCNNPDTLEKTINIAPMVVAQFTTPPAGCVPYDAIINNTSIAGQTFQWDFGDGNTSTATNPTHTYTVAGTYTITLIATDPNTCNVSDTTSFTITVQDNPIANFSFAPTTPVENTPTTFTNLSSPDAVNFKWFFGDGDSLITSSRSPVVHQYNATGTFNACLVAINAAGCADSICMPVDALVVPAVDVPNAFTPNSGDVNSKVFVRGFGIVKMRFIIWNRWGQKVFETDNQYVGWDGKYKGVIQPMDVYAYTLDVEFFDGVKTTKKGDLTLIR